MIFLVGVIIALGLVTEGLAQDLRNKLDSGKINVSSQSVPGTSIRMAEMTAIIKAPPEIVWRVITDLNNYQFFMPRTLKSMALAPEKVAVIVKKHPTRAEEVEKLLGPIPLNPAKYRIPGGKYTVYHYSNLDLPWPCSNRWYIVRVVDDETRAAQHYYYLTWSLVFGNFKENSGQWILEPYDTNETKATYRLRTDLGSAIPGFLIKYGSRTTMPDIIKAVRKRAAKFLQVRDGHTKATS